MPSNRPRGRRPGKTDTRAEIIDAALRLFSAEGYDKVSLRQVAREAQVDPALIHHYFENKAELFTIAVIATPVEDAADAVQYILDGPREGVGERAVDIIITTFESPGANQRFLALLRSSLNAGAPSHPLSEFLSREILGKVAASFEHPDAVHRGQLAMMLIVGLVMSRDIMRFPSLVRQRRPELVAQLGKAMQAFLVEAW